MVRAYHAIWSTYGFWLPNDPRGSWSDFVRSYELYQFGKATKTNAKHSIAATPHDQQKRRAAKSALKHPLFRLTGKMAQSVAHAIGKLNLPIHAFCIMPDHVHTVIGRTDVRIEQQIRKMKQAGTVALRQAKLVNKDRPIWVRGSWQVYMESDKRIHAAIDYVNANPIKAGMRQQNWSFVTPYEKQ